VSTADPPDQSNKNLENPALPKAGDKASGPGTKRRISRRGLIVAGAAGAAVATGVGIGVVAESSTTPKGHKKHSHSKSKKQSSSKNRIDRTVYDVVVVGAGLAGLTAAKSIKDSGHSVLVLEARNRVGGRTYDIPIGSGSVLEMGGEWTGPGQTNVQALARELGVKTFESYAAGNNLYYREGRLATYSGDIPPAQPTALAELEQVIEALNTLTKGFPGETPWTSPEAVAYDVQSVGSWIAARSMTTEASFLTEVAIRGIYGEEAGQVSLVDLLGEIWGVGGDFNTAIGAAQSARFVGGPQQLSVSLSSELGTSVKLGTPVNLIKQGKTPTVHTASTAYQAKQVIVTAPKSVTAAIRFTPALPAAYLEYFQRQPSGATIKVQVVYDSPFWRATGLSGSVVSDTGPIEIVYDNSPPSGTPGVLVGFAEGNFGRSMFSMTEDERKSVVVSNLVRYFGPKAANPTAYYDLVWAQEVYSGGAYGSFNPPGVITALGKYVAGPIDNLRFAGADYSAIWPGYMEGAIISGRGAADEAISALRKGS
jgi:monoamine oxidase